MRRNILFLILALALVCTMLFATTLTASAETYSGNCGSNLTWTLDTETGVLEITGTGEMEDWPGTDSNDAPWHSYRNSIKTVNVGNGVTSIGNYAFYGCTGLTSVTIPDTVTSIGDLAFYDSSETPSCVNVYYAGTETQWNDVTIGSTIVNYGYIHYGVTDPSAHSYLVSSEEPTCASEGSETYGCDCGYTWTAAVPALPHTWEFTETVAPTCTADGYDLETCSICGETQQVNIVPAPGHDFVDGVCTVCGLKLPEDEILTIDGTRPELAYLLYWMAGCPEIGDLENPYSDVSEDTPYLDAILWAYENGFMIGINTVKPTFAPDRPMTRAMLVTALWRYEGGPEEGTNDFEDVPDGKWYTAAVAWASAQSWIDLNSCLSTKFYPNLNVKSITIVKSYTDETVFTFHLELDRAHDFADGVCTVCGEKDPDYTEPTEPTEEPTEPTEEPTEPTEEPTEPTTEPTEPEETVAPIEFNDVKETAWYFDAVNYAVTHKLMNGVGNNSFAPDAPMTRAMLVTVLWRYEGEKKEGSNGFTDVPDGQWYTDAVAWAAHNGIVNGVGPGKFDPNGNITREQMAAILYRYADGKGFDVTKRGDLSGFPDAGKVSDWAKDAIAWTVAEGIIGGSDGKLLPQGNATRAQVATILMRFIENIAKT